MVHYKLFYLTTRGAAETARQLFALSDTPYDDVRIPREELSKHTAGFPFGQIPTLEIDGKRFGQTGAITRYLAEQFGFAGKTPIEKLGVDALCEQFRDYMTEIRLLIFTFAGLEQGDKDKLYKEVEQPAREKFFGYAKRFLKESGSGYLVGNGLTYIDLILAEHSAAMGEIYPDYLKGHKEHMKKVRSTPKLAKWIENRPKTSFF